MTSAFNPFTRGTMRASLRGGMSGPTTWMSLSKATRSGVAPLGQSGISIVARRITGSRSAFAYM
jgi:hypothetical protein